MKTSVLIVGAGPVGLTLALSLKRQGVDARLIDQAAEPSDKSKALVLWPRTLELLDIEDCAPLFVAAGMKAAGARIVADGKEVVHLSLSTAKSDYTYALMLPQSDTERLLAQRLTSLGGHVERQVALQSYVEEGGEVVATLRHADGRIEIARADHLAGCDGAHSTVRHGLDAKFEGETLSSEWLLADVQLDGDLPLDEMTICWAPEGMLVFFPIAGRRFRVIADVGATGSQDATVPSLADVQTLTDARGPAGLRLRDPIWLNRFRINERKVRDYRHGRVFLAGDAAHVHSPAGGQGMNTGMQDAINLAWKLAMVLQGRASKRLLESYSPERSAIGDQVLRNAGNMTRIAMLRNPILQQLRSVAVGALSHVPALRQMMVDQLTETDLHYDQGPLSEHRRLGRGPTSGDRAPNVAIAQADGSASTLYQALRTGSFVVLSVDADPAALPAELRALAMSARAAASSGYESNFLYVVRPDGYVLTSVERTHEPEAFAQLARLRP